MWPKIVLLSLVLALGGCSSVTHYESTTVARADKDQGGVKAIRQLQRGEALTPRRGKRQHQLV